MPEQKLETERRWQTLIRAEKALELAMRRFLSPEIDSLGRLHEELDPESLGDYWEVAVEVMLHLRTEQLKEFLPILIDLATGSQHGVEREVEILLRSLPSEWLRVHIEAAAEPFLERGEIAYRGLMCYYEDLGIDLAERLARRATQQPKEAVQRWGQTWLREHHHGTPEEKGALSPLRTRAVAA